MLRTAINTLTTSWRAIKTTFGVQLVEEPFINRDAFRKIAPCSQPERRYSPEIFVKTEDLAKREFVPLHLSLVPKATYLVTPQNTTLEQAEATTIQEAMKLRDSIKRPPNSKPIPYYRDEILKMKLNEVDWSKLSNFKFPGSSVNNIEKIENLEDLRDTDFNELYEHLDKLNKKNN